MAGPQNGRRSTMSGPTTFWRRRAYEYELPWEPLGQFTCICSAVPPPVLRKRKREKNKHDNKTKTKNMESELRGPHVPERGPLGLRPAWAFKPPAAPRLLQHVSTPNSDPLKAAPDLIPNPAGNRRFWHQGSWTKTSRSTCWTSGGDFVFLLVVLRFCVGPGMVRDGRWTSFPAPGGRFRARVGASQGPTRVSNRVFVKVGRGRARGAFLRGLPPSPGAGSRALK